MKLKAIMSSWLLILALAFMLFKDTVTDYKSNKYGFSLLVYR